MQRRLEKLTSRGVEKLDSPATISELENHLSTVIPFVFGEPDICESFPEVVKRYSDSKLLLFVDNLETLLRDSPECFDDFQMNLPVHWRLLVTSRVNTNSATCLPIGPLSEPTAKHLARIYATRRNASELVQDSIVDKIVRQTHCNPLAIRLGVDSYVLGSPLDESITVASSDVLSFSYKNLLEVISNESVAVLECLFLQDPQTRIELAENLRTSIDMVAKGIHELARTSLVSRDSAQQQELYSLYPSIRDLLLISPRDVELRGKIHQNILRRRIAAVDAEQHQNGLSKHHLDFVPSELPDVVKNVLFETNRVLPQLGKKSSPEDALKLLNRLRELRNEYPNVAVIWRYTAKISSKLGDNGTAQQDLLRATEIDPADISSLKMLGRLAHDLHDYKRSLDCYTKIKELSGWDSRITDIQNARYCCNGYLLALLYLGQYESILRETQDWSSEDAFKDIRGSFRARAWKRSIENSYDVSDKTHALNKAANILDDIAKQYGYPDMSRRVYQEVVEEISRSADMEKFPDCKQADALLGFVARNITHVYKDEGEEFESVLTIVQTLRGVSRPDNPFRNGEWHEFLKRKGGMVYLAEDRKDALSQAGFTAATVYHIPRVNSPFLFAKDVSGTQYFVHFSRATGASWQEWTRLKDGAELAIKASSSTSTEKALRATEVVILSTS